MSREKENIILGDTGEEQPAEQAAGGSAEVGAEGGGDSLKPESLEEFSKRLKEAREVFVDADVKHKKHLSDMGDLEIPKDIVERYEKTKASDEALQAEYAERAKDFLVSNMKKEEIRREQRVRAGVVGRAKQLGRAEKVGGIWEFGEEFIEKAHEEMKAAVRQAETAAKERARAEGEAPSEVETPFTEEGQEPEQTRSLKVGNWVIWESQGAIQWAKPREIKSIEVGPDGKEYALFEPDGKDDFGTGIRLDQLSLAQNLDTGIGEASVTPAEAGAEGGGDSLKPESLEEFSKRLKEAREVFVDAEVEYGKYRSRIAISEKIPFLRVVMEGLGMPKDIVEHYNEAKSAYEEIWAEYRAERVLMALEEQSLRIDALIQEKEKLQIGFGKLVRRGWEGLAQKKIFDGVNARMALGFGLTGAGLALSPASLPALGAALLLGQRLFSGLSAGFGSHQLMEGIAERKFSESKEKLKVACELLDAKLEKGADKDIDEDPNKNAEGYRDMLKTNLSEWMAMIEIESLRKGQRLSGNEEYLGVRRRYNEILEKEKVENLKVFIQEQNRAFNLRREKSARSELYRKVAATGIGVFAASGVVGLAAREVSEFFGIGRAPDAPGVDAAKPDAPSISIPETATPEAVVEETGNIKSMTINPGGSAWEAAHRFAREGIISQQVFAEAWSNPDSMIELNDGRIVHISDLHLTHPGDQVLLIEGADGAYRFDVVDYTGNQLHFDAPADPTGDLADAAKERAPEISPLESQPESQPELHEVTEADQQVDYFEQMQEVREIATLEAPFPVEYWVGQRFTDYLAAATERWDGKALFVPDLAGGTPKVSSPEALDRLMGWFNQRGDIIAENFINNGRVAVVTVPQPADSYFDVIKLISTDERTPWTQGRLIPREVLRGF